MNADFLVDALILLNNKPFHHSTVTHWVSPSTLHGLAKKLNLATIAIALGKGYPNAAQAIAGERCLACQAKIFRQFCAQLRNLG